MRISGTIIVFALAWVMNSCSPKVTSSIIHKYHPLESVEEVVVLSENEKLPGDAEWIGSTTVDGRADYERMLAMTRFEAWKYGGKYVKIKNFTSLDRKSVLNIMNSDIYRSDLDDNSFSLTDYVNAQNPEQREVISSLIPNTETSRFYLSAGANLEYTKMESSDASFLLSFGAGFFVSKDWSLEIGAEYAKRTLKINNSNSESTANGIAAALVYHCKWTERLYYLPQVSLEYIYVNAKSGNTRIKYEAACASLVPLVFEYRSEDNLWGFQAGVGAVGLAFPIIGSKNLDYVLNLNQFSIGVVKYF